MEKDLKDLLIRDLSSRLPYGVKCEVYNRVGTLIEVSEYGFAVTYDNGVEETTCQINNIKPYLFPMSSMTEEQHKEYRSLVWFDGLSHGWGRDDAVILNEVEMLIDFYHKNHLDWRGLIPMGLANDATGLNIY